MNRYTLRKRQIARNANDLRTVLKQGRRLRKNGLLLISSKSEQRKVCCIVKKCAGNAVERNRLKRWMREFYRLHQHDNPNNSTLVWIVEERNEHVTGGYQKFWALMTELMNGVTL